MSFRSEQLYLLKQLFAEFGGTFLYLSITSLNGTGSEASIDQPLVNGLVFASIVIITGHISGGHLNPAITLGFLCRGKNHRSEIMEIVTAVLYIVAQIAGSILGALVAYYLTVSPYKGNLGATIPNESMKTGQVFGLELIMTFLLVAVALKLDVKSHSLASTSLAIGFCITACQCSTLPYIVSLNPVKSLGPAVIMKVWPLHWVYWLGPLLGGAAAGLIHRIFRILNTR